LKWKGSAFDKTQPLSLSNPYIRDELNGANIVVANPSDPFCLCALFQRYVATAFPPGYKGRLFRREAPKKELERRKKSGEHHLADLSAGGVFGKN
jgi:hypothetical protein